MGRTIKVMMVIVRGGNVVNKKWLNPINYERWPNWKEAARKARECKPSNALFSDYCIYIQQRTEIAAPSDLILQHLAHCGGAKIVDKNGKNQRLKKKEKNNESDEEEVDDDDDDDDMNKNKKKKKKKKKRCIVEESDDSEEKEESDSDYKKTKKKKTKKKKHFKRVIISHPAIYKRLKLKKRDKKSVRVVTANWIFDSIERYEVVPFDKKYIVKPNQAQST